MHELSLWVMWILAAALLVFMVTKVFLKDSFLVSLVSLVVIAAVGVVPPTTFETDPTPWVWAAAVPGAVAGWLLRPLNPVAGPIRARAADGGVYHYTDEDRSILRRVRLMASAIPLGITALVVIVFAFAELGAPALGAGSVGFALAALTGVLSRRLTGILEVRHG